MTAPYGLSCIEAKSWCFAPTLQARVGYLAAPRAPQFLPGLLMNAVAPEPKGVTPGHRSKPVAAKRRPPGRGRIGTAGQQRGLEELGVTSAAFHIRT